MGIEAIIALLIGIGAALVGFLGGHKTGKSSGVKQGQEQAQQAAEVAQAQSQHKATEERLNANQSAADASDADLDRELSKYDRKN